MNQRNNPNQTDRRLLTVSDRDIFVTVQKALLVGIILTNETRADKEESLKELTNLVKTAGSNPSIIQTKRVDRINPKTFIGKGSIILTGSVINTGTEIGEHCLINTSSIIDHDNTLKNFSSTGPGVTTGGNTQLGQCSHLGIGSTVKHQISIGDNTIVGAQSLVVKNCENNSVYFGIPAKKIKNREDNSKYL